MHFKFKNGNTTCSIEGQSFTANSKGVFTIPHALGPRLIQDYGPDIESADPSDSSMAIEDMSREQLIETILADGRKHLATPSIEELRTMAQRTRGDDDKVPDGFNPDAVTAEDIDTMPRAELFAFLKKNDVRTDGKMTNDELRAQAHEVLSKADAAKAK